MFVYSMRMSTIRFVGVIGLSVIVLVTLLAFVPAYEPAALINQQNKIVYTGADSVAGRSGFAAQFGWELAPASETKEKVIIPSTFNEIFTDYNALQKSQGLNLEKYMGKTATKYSYIVTNYPEYDGEVRINLLVYKKRVIGGDISSAALDGFTRGFANGS